MLRGSEKSTVRPVCSSMLATLMESGTQAPAVLAGVAAEQQDVVAAVVRVAGGGSVEHGEDEVTVDGHQVRREEQAPAVTKHRAVFSTTVAARCGRRRRNGSPRRHASLSSSTQATASTGSSRRTTSSSVGFVPSVSSQPRLMSPATATTRPTATSASQVPIAIRPIRLLPATSCAAPGASSVITRSDTDRRSRIESVR
jgi:hypothetical protein